MAILLIFWINLTKLEGSAQGKIAHVLNSPGTQGCTVVLVNPKQTSQMCSRCGQLVKKTLSDRVHNCPYCGL
ncbi:zinc ribbon domain-containing protein, partial [Methanoculleus sp.]